MGLRDIEIKTEYRGKASDIARTLFAPILSEAISYDRIINSFTLDSLIEVVQGLERIVHQKGKVRLIVSLSRSDGIFGQGDNDENSHVEGIVRHLVDNLMEAEQRSSVSRHQLNMLSSLIVTGLLDVRVVLSDGTSGYGPYYERIAIITDESEDSVVLSGLTDDFVVPANDAFVAVDVFRSWNDQEGRVKAKQAAFDAVWMNQMTGLETFDVPELKEGIVNRFQAAALNFADDLNDVAPERMNSPYPRIPEGFVLRSYQEEAISSWREMGYCGIYDMATGTGKTFTALASIVDLCHFVDNSLAAVIVCPYQHLVDQWVENVTLFNIDPIIGYSSSPQPDWFGRLDKAIRNQKYGVKNSDFFCFICTNSTYASNRVQSMLDKIRKPKLLVVDEAHYFGAEYIRTLLRDDFRYRLALSATIERHRDVEGTNAIFEYFGERCIEYTLEEAIYGRGDEPPCLVPYEYHPIVVYLEDDELRQYSALSAEIAKNVIVEIDGSKKLSPYGEILALERARLVGSARAKLPALKQAIQPYVKDNYILVYCGAGKTEVSGEVVQGVDDYEVRQIDVVTNLLGGELNMSVRQFTSRESSSERDDIKRMFSDADLQVLIAIKCLDEGVDIPMIKTAFIMASTTNPREYIQRRGRLLRKDPCGRKDKAEIYDFITLPRPPEEAAYLPNSFLQGERRLAHRELVRAREFSDLALNSMELSAILDEIEEGYFGLSGIGMYEGEGECE